MDNARKVLLIRLSSLGDVVLATAALETLNRGLPDAEVHVLTKPAFGDVFRNHPGASHTLNWQPSEGIRALARSIRRGEYDWVVDLHANLRTRLLRLLVRGPRWSVYRKGAIRRRLAVKLSRSGLLGSEHVVDRYVRALGPMGVEPRRCLPRIHHDPAAAERVTGPLVHAGWDGTASLVALSPGARWQTKAWPAEHWTELIGAVERERLGFPVLLGGEAERCICAEILESSGALGANLAGETSVVDLSEAIRRSAALVTNDSAPLHLATAVGTPVVALFGPTVEGFGFFPLGPEDRLLELDLKCRPCSLHGDRRCPLGHHACLRELRPAQVVEALVEVLTAVRRQAGDTELQEYGSVPG